jgi:hypothetical protein
MDRALTSTEYKRLVEHSPVMVAIVSHDIRDPLNSIHLSRQREGAGFSVDPKPTDLHAMCHRVIEEVRSIVTDRQLTPSR